MVSERALITGGAGFLGLHLGRYLQKKGYKVDLLDNFRRGIKDDDLNSFLLLPSTRLMEIDLLSPKGMSCLDKNYTHVFHFAAIVGVAKVLEAPFEVLSCNYEMLARILKYASGLTELKRFVFASTSEVYAGALFHHGLEFPTPETVSLTLTDLKHPRTSYMLSKIYGEALCLQSGIPCTIVRPHNLYGPRMGLSHVIPELFQRASKLNTNEELDIFSGDDRRTFCYIEDGTSMIGELAESTNSVGEAFNVGVESPELSIRELAAKILATVGRVTSIRSGRKTPGSPARRCPSMKKTFATISYRPQYSIELGLAATYAWYKENVFKATGVSAH